MKKNNKKGLTLIELLAVIAIIAILFVLLIPQISNSIDKSKKTGVQMDLRAYYTALNQYNMEEPQTDVELEVINKYLEKELQFDENLKSKKKNPYGEKYEIKITKSTIYTNKLAITSYKNNKKEVEYTLVYHKMNGDYVLKIIDNKEREFEVTTCTNENKKTDFTYKEKDGEIKIEKYIGEEREVIIPCKIDGKDVTSIGEAAFRNSGIKSVLLPNKLKHIGGAAFHNNMLTELYIPNTVTTVDGMPFYVNSLVNIHISENMTSISREMFTLNFISDIEIPSNIKEVHEYAFSGNMLINLKLNEGLEDIKTYAFSFNKIKEVEIPSTVKNIVTKAFVGNDMSTYKIKGTPTIETEAFPTSAVRK